MIIIVFIKYDNYVLFLQHFDHILKIDSGIMVNNRSSEKNISVSLSLVEVYPKYDKHSRDVFRMSFRDSVFFSLNFSVRYPINRRSDLEVAYKIHRRNTLYVLYKHFCLISKPNISLMTYKPRSIIY